MRTNNEELIFGPAATVHPLLANAFLSGHSSPTISPLRYRLNNSFGSRRYANAKRQRTGCTRLCTSERFAE
jgi:hypothetical protein